MHHRLLITKAGLVFIGITTFVLIAAVNSQSNLLFFAFGLMLGALLVSALLSALTLMGMEVRRLRPDHFAANEPAEIHYLVTNKKRLWPAFSLHITEHHPEILLESPAAYAIHIAPRHAARLPARLVPIRRGTIHLSTIRLSSSFPFGFIEHSVLHHHPEELVVYPRIGILNRHLALRTRDSVESGTMTSAVRGGADEFYGIREYRAGDNMRSIHWRSSARTGQLMIREMAANAPPQLVVVLNLRRWSELPDPAEQTEHAIELAAALLCYGFLENFAVGLAIAGIPSDTPPIPQMGRDARTRLLHQLSAIDIKSIRPDISIPLPNRLVGRAEWIIISLRQSNPFRDLTPATSGAASHNPNILSLDNPDAPNWLIFPNSTIAPRILREPNTTHKS